MAAIAEEVIKPASFDRITARPTLAPLPRPDRRFHASRVKRNRGIVKSVKRLTHDTLEVVVKCDEGSTPFNAFAGQYATLQTEGLPKPRAYSFAKAPCQERENEYTFFIKMVAGGSFSSWLFSKDRTGAPINISGPMGKFGLDDSKKTILAIAAGSGMSAIKALLEEAAVRKVPRDCVFLYGARTQADLYCLDELDAIRRNWHADHTCEIINVLSRETQESGWTGPRGRVQSYLEAAYLSCGKLEVASTKVFFCGSPGLVDDGIALLNRYGFESDDILFDKFEDALSPAPVINNSACVLCDECLIKKPVESCIVEAASLTRKVNDDAFSYELVDPAYTSGIYYNTLFIDSKECIRCYACVEACPVGAISPKFAIDASTLRQTFDGGPVKE